MCRPGLSPPLVLVLCLIWWKSAAFFASPGICRQLQPEHSQIEVCPAQLRQSCPLRLTCCGCSSSKSSVAEQVDLQQVADSRAVKVVAVVPSTGDNARSTSLNATWIEIMQHMNRRLGFVDPALSLDVVTEEEILQHGQEAMPRAHPDMLYFVHVHQSKVASLLQPYIEQVPQLISLDSDQTLQQQTRLGPARPYSPLSYLWRFLPRGRRKKSLGVYDSLVDFYRRGHSEDVLMTFLVAINAAIKNIPSVSEILKPLSLKATKCMLTNCWQQIVDCQKNPVCKAGLACLEKCAPNDQVCRYRCIVQYESKEFEQFALCILQKHNCLENRAEIQMRPDPSPLSHFKGQPLTHEMAEEISFAHLGKLPWSWKVICGQNPAYDFFPDQHMIYYPKGKQMWYQPVFRVITHDDKLVWRKRLYRVRRGKVPGTFYYSVLDNGVVSLEYWRLLDADEDLNWVLFYYSGAAAAAGQSYQGAILASPDGEWPAGDPAYLDRIYAGLDRAGITPWELFRVRHIGTEDAPFTIDAATADRFQYPRTEQPSPAPA